MLTIISDITGPTSSPPIDLTTCYPTISSDYSVSRIEQVVANLSLYTAANYNAFLDFMGGVTPVMTIFAPDSFGGITPEVHLNCLKIRSDNLTSTGGSGPVTSTASLTPSTDSYFAALSLLLGMIWWL
jgi:hypothetical protein